MEYAYDGRAWTARSGLRPYRFLKTSLLHRLRPRLTAGYLALGRKVYVLITILRLLIYDFAMVANSYFRKVRKSSKSNIRGP